MKDLIRLSESQLGVFATTTSKTDAVTTRVMRPGEFKVQYLKQYPDATNRERKIAYERYVRDEALNLARSIDFAKVIGLIAEGKVGVKQVKASGDDKTLTTVFVDLSASVNPVEMKRQASQMKEAEIRDLMEFLQQQLQSQAKEAKNDFANLLAQ